MVLRYKNTESLNIKKPGIAGLFCFSELDDLEKLTIVVSFAGPALLGYVV